MSERESFIEFQGGGESASGKTGIYLVVAKTGGKNLGEVRWFGRWRCYGFYPYEGTVFERHCLRDIADFCERQTTSQLKRKPA